MKNKKPTSTIKYASAKKKFSNNLKELRLKKGLTQESMEDKFGISTRVYQKYESGQSNPTLETLILLSQSFNVSILDLLKDID